MQYTVKAGDSLSKIGASLGVDWHKITGYRSGNPNLIYAGEVLNVPDKVAATPSVVKTTQPIVTTTPSVSTPSAPAQQTGAPDFETAYKELYPGWGRESALADYNAGNWRNKAGAEKFTSGAGATPGQSSISSLISPTPAIDLTAVYDKAFEEAGITDLENDLAKKKEDLTRGKGIVNENPWISAQEKGGRITKLEELANEEITNLQNEIIMKKADVETKINLKAKQIDINSTAARDALSSLNTLLGLGVFSNISTDDIVNVAKATGLSTSMITGAIDYAKSKNVETQIFSETDDAGNVTYVTLDKKTGQKIATQEMGQIGKSKETTPSPTKLTQQDFLSDAKTVQGKQTPSGWVGQFPQLVAKYAPYFTLEEIYQLYNSSELGRKYGVPSESAAEIKSIYDTYRGSFL